MGQEDNGKNGLVEGMTTNPHSSPATILSEQGMKKIQVDRKETDRKFYPFVWERWGNANLEWERKQWDVLTLLTELVRTWAFNSKEAAMRHDIGEPSVAEVIKKTCTLKKRGYKWVTLKKRKQEKAWSGHECKANLERSLHTESQSHKCLTRCARDRTHKPPFKSPSQALCSSSTANPADVPEGRHPLTFLYWFIVASLHSPDGTITSLFLSKLSTVNTSLTRASWCHTTATQLRS